MFYGLSVDPLQQAHFGKVCETPKSKVTSLGNITRIPNYLNSQDFETLQNYAINTFKEGTASNIKFVDNSRRDITLANGSEELDAQNPRQVLSNAINDEPVEKILSTVILNARGDLIKNHPDLQADLNGDIVVEAFISTRPLVLNADNKLVGCHADFGIGSAVIPLELPQTAFGGEFYLTSEDVPEGEESTSKFSNAAKPVENQAILFRDQGQFHGVTNMKPSQGRILNQDDTPTLKRKTPRTVLVIIFKKAKN